MRVQGSALCSPGACPSPAHGNAPVLLPAVAGCAPAPAMPPLLHGTHLALLGSELKEQQNDNQSQQMSIIWLIPASTDIWSALCWGWH